MLYQQKSILSDRDSDKLRYIEMAEKKTGELPNPSTFREFHIFVDGSATDQAKTFRKKHLRRAGAGVYHPASGTRIAEPFPLPNPTNNRAEYWACIRALEWVLEQTESIGIENQGRIKVVLYCDSQLLISSMTIWIEGWRRRGWKKSDGQPVKNLELVKKLDELIKNRLPKTAFVKVKAHKRKPPRTNERAIWLWNGNDIADKLANQGRKIAEQG